MSKNKFQDLLDVVEQLALGGHGDKVEQIFSHLHKSIGYNQEACNLILRLLNKDQEEVAKTMLKTMPKTPNVEDTMFKGAFYVKHLMKLNKPVDALIQSCRDLQNEGLIPSAIYIATEAALTQGRSELAQKLFNELKKDGMEIRQHFYWPLLVQKGKERDEEGLLQIVRNMCSEGLAPSGEALRDYIIPFLIEKDTPQNIILKLQVANVPTILSARSVMIELLESGKIKAAAEVALNYRTRGQYSLFSRPLVSALKTTKDIKSFVTILHVACSNFQLPQEDTANDDLQSDDNDINEVGRIVKNAIKVIARDDLVEELLSSLLSKGLRISTSSAEQIEQYLGNNMTTKISELLTQLTSTELEVAPLEFVRRNQIPRTAAQLETLLEQVISKDGNNVNRLRKQVLSAYIQEKNVEKVKSLVENFKTTDFDFNLSTLAQLFEFYCEHDEIDKANDVKAEIAKKDTNFNLNNYKKVSMACAYVRANRIDEAIKFLNDNKPQAETENTAFLLNSKTWQMLNSLAETKNDTAVSTLIIVRI